MPPRRGMRHRQAAVAGCMVLAAMLSACTDGGPAGPQEVRLPNDPGAVALSRVLWARASMPADANGGAWVTGGRVSTIRWFLPREVVRARWLDPWLEGPARDEAVQVLELFLRKDEGEWLNGDWGGVMTSPQAWVEDGIFPDISAMTFLDVWVNDGHRDRADRRGRLHVDFGFISEDGCWPDGGLDVGTWQSEDGNNGVPDGIFTPDDDLGLSGDGDDAFSAEYNSDDDPYPGINGTAFNGRFDDEDLDGNGRLDLDNGYFTTSIDLADTSAFFDAVYDYGGFDLPLDQAWRLYKLPILPARVVAADVEPDRRRITHLRIWFEDDVGEEPSSPRRTTHRLQIAGLRFH